MGITTEEKGVVAMQARLTRSRCKERVYRMGWVGDYATVVRVHFDPEMPVSDGVLIKCSPFGMDAIRDDLHKVHERSGRKGQELYLKVWTGREDV